MERKIGEIFEYHGEWYQCLKEKYCNGCVFRDAKCDDVRKILGNCSVRNRSDKISVIFKKLEKVGEQFLYKGKQMQSYIRATDELICNWNNNLLLLEHGDSNIIDIEIKQTKENMEEYRMYDAKEDIPEFDKVVDECLFGENKLNLKPFDLEAAKAGKPVCTRDGRKARIICFNRKDNIYPIIALVECGKNEDMSLYMKDGRYIISEKENDRDLMMLSEKHEGWVNIYKSNYNHTRYVGGIYKTKKEALKGADYTVVDTVKIEWEE